MKILFQGDSITDGNRFKDKDLEWDKNHQIGHSYAYIVSGVLSLKNPDKNYHFINRGISGNKAGDLLFRWKEDCLKIEPDLLIVLVGINDIFFTENGFSPKVFLENYRNLLLQAKENKSTLKIVLLEPFAYLETPLAKMYNVKNSDMEIAQKIVMDLANEFNAEFVPLQSDFTERENNPNYEYWIWDGIHPTEAGHALIAQKVIKTLERIL